MRVGFSGVPFDPGRLLFGGAAGLEAVVRCLRLITVSGMNFTAAKLKQQIPNRVRGDCEGQRLATSFIRDKSVNEAIPVRR